MSRVIIQLKDKAPGGQSIKGIMVTDLNRTMLADPSVRADLQTKFERLNGNLKDTFNTMGLISAEICERILGLLETLGFDLFANELLHGDSVGTLMVLKGLEEFREHLGGELTITLLKDIGQGIEVHEMKLPQVVAAIQELYQRQCGRMRNPQTVHLPAVAR